MVAALALGAAAAPGATGTGALAGATQISFGCPGPVRDGDLGCHPWHPYPGARFRLVRLDASGAPLPGTARIVASNTRARFKLTVRTGVYRLTPLPQHNTHGGPALVVRVTAAAPTNALVRFVGFPQML